MQHIFSLEIVSADEEALLRERVAVACCGSKLPRVYRPLCQHVFVRCSVFGCRDNHAVPLFVLSLLGSHDSISLCVVLLNKLRFMILL